MSLLLRFDLILQVVDLTLLDTLQAHRIISRLLNFSHELFLFFCQVLDASLHLLLVFFGLFVLLAGYALRTMKALPCDMELISGDTMLASLGLGPYRLGSRVDRPVCTTITIILTHVVTTCIDIDLLSLSWWHIGC